MIEIIFILDAHMAIQTNLGTRPGQTRVARPAVGGIGELPAASVSRVAESPRAESQPALPVHSTDQLQKQAPADIVPGGQVGGKSTRQNDQPIGDCTEMKRLTILARILLLTALAGGILAGRVARADGTNVTDEIQALKEQIRLLDEKVRQLEQKQAAPATEPSAQARDQQVQELDQKVRVLERQKELDAAAAEAKAKEAPRIVAGASGLSVSSGDSNFVFQLHGLLQTDNRTYFDDGGNHANDGFVLRRARPIFSGTMFRDFDFIFTPDFGGSTVQIVDAFLNYRYQPWIQLRAGKFKAPIGLEQMQGDPATAFNERSLVTGLMPARDLGFMLWGDVGAGTFNYGIGVFNGQGDARNAGTTDFEDHREFTGRVFLQPFKKTDVKILKGFGIGVGGSYGNVFSNATGLPSTTGGTQPGYYTEAQQQFFAYTNGAVANGDHWRISPQASYYLGPVGILGEYAISEQRVSRGTAPLTSTWLKHTAWDVTGCLVLTGEDASYTGVTPKHPFDLSAGHWGAFQIVGRYSGMDVDNAAFPLYVLPGSATGAQAWSVGLNWFLNRTLRINTSFTRTTFNGSRDSGANPPANITRQPEEALITRLQLAF